jgi:hypothetical protein
VTGKERGNDVKEIEGQMDPGKEKESGLDPILETGCAPNEENGREINRAATLRYFCLI